ncbi:MAG TPA: hypothetical protein VNN17_07285, partial [Terriglobia bacterium]|nr:hypothetical protein [Terriglobia bacterium]
IPVSFASGWAISRPGDSPEALLDRADHALYQDKRRRQRTALAEFAPAACEDATNSVVLSVGVRAS